MERVVADILFDFGTKPRLISQRGTAMLVAASIHEACRYYELFEKTPLKGRCAIVTSYNPQAGDISLEDTGANSETDKQFIYHLYTRLLQDVAADPGKTKTETYEERATALFVEEPARMRLLIVVDKLLTGFDAPSCTYLYIDKSMQDHGLFQAICRTNRLDGDDKPFGFIVDYKDLFPKVQGAISVYSSELDHSAGGASPDVHLQERLEKGRQRLEQAREAYALVCEPVAPPKDDLRHIHSFCGNVELPEDLAAHEPQRVALYKAVAALLRAYASIADALGDAGYPPGQAATIQREVEQAVALRAIIRRASGETLDLKAYEADMRHLIDTYIRADEARVISSFGDVGLLELIVRSGIADAVGSLPKGIRGNRDAVAETIANNVRSRIIQERLHDPAFYERMSVLLADVIEELKARRIEYEEFLARIARLAAQVQAGQADDTPEPLRRSAGLRAIYNLLARQRSPEEVIADHGGGYSAAPDAEALELAQRIDRRLRTEAPNGWRGVLPKQQVVKRLIFEVVQDTALVERLFTIVVAQPEY